MTARGDTPHCRGLWSICEAWPGRTWVEDSSGISAALPSSLFAYLACSTLELRRQACVDAAADNNCVRNCVCVCVCVSLASLHAVVCRYIFGYGGPSGYTMGGCSAHAQ